MSHEITNVDCQEGIEMAWHKLTKVMEKISLRLSWLAQWDITKAPLFVLDGEGKPIATNHCQLVASDDARIQIGGPVHCDTYQPITNASFIEIVEDAIKGIDSAQVASVGSVCGRGRVFISVKLAQLEAFKAAGREFKPYLNFLNSHDQSSAFAVNTSTICTVCNNTFGMNLHTLDGQRSGMKAASEQKEVRVKLKHTKNIALRLENVPELVDGFLGAQAEFRAVMETLQSAEIAKVAVKPLFTGFLMGNDLPKDLSKVSKDELALSTRRANQIERLTELHFEGAGNGGRTMADAFSAVTDYFTHESSGGEDVMRQVVSSEYGAGQGHKARAFGLFQRGNEVKNLIEIGNTVLAAN